MMPMPSVPEGLSVGGQPIWADIAFWVFAVCSVGFGYRVFKSQSMVRATLALLGSFANVGAIILLMAANYLGVALIFMMTVEMTVMVLFMVAFMMNPAGLNPMQMVHQPKVAACAGWVTFIAGGGLAAFADLPRRSLSGIGDPTAALGTELLGDSMLVFETVGVTLLATMVGAVVLSSKRSRFGAQSGDEGSLPPMLDPVLGIYPEGVLPRPASGEHSMDMGSGAG